MTAPTEAQREATLAVVRWYLARHYRSAEEPGLPQMYADPAQVGPFAVDLERLRSGEAEALFTVLVTTAMFQRLRDSIVKRILQRVPVDVVTVLTDEHALRHLAAEATCPALAETTALRTACDLGKHPQTGVGQCSQAAPGACHLHHHTAVLRRYGHFGKVPTSIALAVAEAGVPDVGALHRAAREGRPPLEAARWLEGSLSKAWRVSDKISAMFLSLVSNPDIFEGAPWSDGVDWTHFVVIDVNVDHFLRAVGYPGPWTYRARRAFIQALAQEVFLDEEQAGLQRYNPRLVQQALYLFMSKANRTELSQDCSKEPGACARCPEVLAAPCPLRVAPVDA